MFCNFRNKPGESLVKGYTRFRTLPDNCPHHELPPWLVLHIFYGGLSKENKDEVDMASGGAFMEHTITQACGLLDKIHHNRETWALYVGGEGGVELDYYCIKSFSKSSEVDELGGDFHLDSNIIL
jgi:hypothetical protein